MGVKSIVAQDAVEAYTPEVDYVVRYFADDGDGKFEETDLVSGDTKTAPTEVGKYFVVAMDNDTIDLWRTGTAGEWDNAEGLVNADGTPVQGAIVQYFEVVPQSLEEAQVVNAAGVSEFTYNGSSQDIYLSLNGKNLVAGDDYNLQILDAASSSVPVLDKGDYYTTTGKLNAGKYTAVVTGKGGFQNDKIEIPFEVSQLNLEEAVVFAQDLEDGKTYTISDTVYVNGSRLSALSEVVRTQTSYTNASGNTYGQGDANCSQLTDGSYNYTGAFGFRLAASANQSNVVGSIDYVQNVCDVIVPASDFLYDGKQLDLAAGLEGRVFDLSEGEAYDASKISVTGHKASEYTVSLATADAAKAGEYIVSVKMNVPSDFSVGGGSMASFTVLNGIIDSSSVEAVVLIDGVNYDFGETYTAKYVPEGVEPNVTIKAGKDVLTEGEDYDVVYTDSTGAEVETMVDADTYTVTVKLKNGYAFDKNGTTSKSLTVKIQQREFDSVELVEDFVLNAGDNIVDDKGNVIGAENDVDALLYTGSEIAPQFVGTYADKDGDVHTVVLDSSWYDVTGIMYKAKGAEKFVPAESILEAGEYKVNLTPAAACKNYTWKAQIPVDDFQVVKAAKFADVASDAWYANSVLSASANGYMNGFAGTNLFGPLAEISRAEVAQVFYNMAGATSGNWATNDFSDVEQSDWFASAVAWASAYGIVTGYEGTDAFGPSDDATREQVATMIYRYAKAQGMDVTVEDEAAALAEYKDGASVSEYAKTAMAYCVEQGVFGVDVDTLRPQDNLSRAEMAATSVRVQPEGAKEIL